MALFGEIARRLRVLLRGSRFDRDLDEEMQTHLELRQGRLRAGGLSLEDAGRAARMRFGNVLRLREEAHDAWGWTWLEQLAQDLRFSARTLSRNPGFTATAVLTLALATGASTAIFTVLNGVVLRPLPFRQPERLVQVYGTDPATLTGSIGWHDLDAFRRQSTAFDAFVAYQPTVRFLQGPTGPERLTAVLTETGLFSLLGADAIAGRTFRADESSDVAVISADLWQRRFQRDPSLPGRSILLDGGRGVTVVGVMPDHFQFPYSAASLMPGALPESRTDLWVPYDPSPRGRASYVMARLRPGISIDAAGAELRVIAARLEKQYPDTNEHASARLEPLTEVVVGRVRRSLWMLLAAVGLVLAGACANLANLSLARMTVRTREVVTRAALGASRARLVRQFLAESLLLSLVGGALGALVGHWGTQLLVALGSTRIPRAHEVGFDGVAFGFLLLACVVTAVFFGLAPALTAARIDSRPCARHGGDGLLGRGAARIRDGLVMVEIALAFMLALSGALLMREAARLQHVDMGMITKNVLVVHLSPRAPVQDYYAIEERVAVLRGVRAAGFTQLVPLQNWGWEAGFSIHGRSTESSTTLPIAGLRYVTPGYFRALGIRLIRGRGFTAADVAGAPRVVVINETLAHRYFQDRDPLGTELDRGRIVGIVADVPQSAVDRAAEPDLYHPAAQAIAMTSDLGMSLIVRTAGASEPLIDAVRAAVRQVNPKLAVFNVKTMDQVVADSLWALNLYRWLIGLFAALTVAIAVIGVYGVISYNATSRTREFAVRLAIGSDPAGLTRLVLARAARLAAGGLTAGILGALAATPALRTLPLASGARPLTYAAVAASLVMVALLAALVPAMRLRSIDPAAALRHD